MPSNKPTQGRFSVSTGFAVLKYLQDVGSTVTSEDIANGVSTSNPASLLKTLNTLHDKGLVYSVGGNYFGITRKGVEVVDGTLGSNWSRSSYAPKAVSNPATFVNEYVHPAIDHLITLHPEYTKYFEKVKSDFRLGSAFLSQVHKILANEEFRLMNNETKSDIDDRIRSSVENIVMYNLMRFLKYNQYGSPSPTIVNNTQWEELRGYVKDAEPEKMYASRIDMRNFLANEFPTWFAGVIQHIPPGTIIDLENIRTLMGAGGLGYSDASIAIGQNMFYSAARSYIAGHPEVHVLVDNMSSDQMAEKLKTIVHAFGSTASSVVSQFVSHKDKYTAEVITALFEGDNFDGYNFKGMDLSSINDVTISGCSFVGANLSGMVWDGLTVRNCKFNDANLSNARSFKPKVFSGNNIDGANFSGTAINEESNFAIDRNEGRPKNLVYNVAMVDRDSYDRMVATESAGPLLMYQPISQWDLVVIKGITEGMANYVGKKKLSSLLLFSEMDLDDDTLKADMSMFESSGTIPSWATSRDAVVKRIQAMKRLQISQHVINKLMSFVSQKPQQVDKFKQKSRDEIFQDNFRQFFEAHAQDEIISRDELISIFPSANDVRSGIRDYISLFPADLTPQHIQTILSAISGGINRLNMLPPNMRAVVTKSFKPFSHAIRIVDTSSGKGYNFTAHLGTKMFSIVEEARTDGVPDDIIPIVNAIIAGETQSNPHYPGNVVAWGRVKPYVVQSTNQEGDINVQRYWIIQELQSDIIQKPYRLAYFVSGKYNDQSWWNILADTVELNSTPHNILKTIALLGGKTSKERLLQQFTGVKEFTSRIYHDDLSKRIITDQELAALHAVRSATLDGSFLLKGDLRKAVSLITNITKKDEREIDPQPLINKLVRSGKIEVTEDRLTATEKGIEALKAGNPENFVDVPTILSDVIAKSLKILGSYDLVSSTGNVISISDAGRVVLDAYVKVSKFRNYYKSWSEVMIMNTVMRAHDNGVDKVLVPSASRFSVASTRDISAHFDVPARKFTKKTMVPGFSVAKDSGSALWSNVSEKFYPTKYYEIDVKQLMQYNTDPQEKKTSLHFSSLDKTSGWMENFTAFYESTVAKYDHLKYMSIDMFIETYLVNLSKKLNHQQGRKEETLRNIGRELSETMGVTISYPPADYASVVHAYWTSMVETLPDRVKDLSEPADKVAEEIFELMCEMWTGRTDSESRHINVDRLREVVRTVINPRLIETIKDRLDDAEDPASRVLNNKRYDRGDQGQPVDSEGNPIEEPDDDTGDLSLNSPIFREPTEKDIEYEKKGLIDRYLDDLNDARARGDSAGMEKARKKLLQLTTESMLRFATL